MLKNVAVAGEPVQARTDRSRTPRRHFRWTPYWFMLPALIVLGVFIVIPIGYAFLLSLYRYQWNMPNLATPFIGLKNYTDIFSNTDLLNSVGWTLAFTVGSVSIEFVLGFSLALLLNARLMGRLRGLLRGVFLIPMMMSGAVAGFMWRMLFDPEYGPINHLLSLIGIGLIHWFTDGTATKLAVMTVDIWLAMPFIMLVLLAGLQGIPEALYEAGRIDGASSAQLFGFITVPLLRFPIMIALIIRSMDALRIFDLIFSLTKNGPGYATSTVVLYTYHYAMDYFQMGKASAISFVFLIIIAAISVVYMRLLCADETA